jgi:nondiscriminating aspartyl-tRNA synthetase
MKNRIYTQELPSQIGKQVLLAGWMHKFRNMGKIGFLILRDKTGTTQCVVSNEEHIAILKELQVESVLKVTGTVVEATGGVEVQVESVEILSPVKEIIPVEINKKEIDAIQETILDNAAVTLRHEKRKAIFKVQAVIMQAYREYMEQQGFTEIAFPVLSGTSSEGGSEFFEVNYYDKKATLVQSAQLYKQITMGVYEGVYGLGYSFRAEKYATSRHLTEFMQLDFELGFIDSMYDLMEYNEGAVRHIVKRVSERSKKELEILEAKLPELGTVFPRITLEEALQFYKEEAGIDETGEPDLSPAAEKWLSTVWAPKHHGTRFVFVTHYPESKRPFYTMVCKENPNLTDSYDLVGNGCEITTGGQRINEYEMQVKRIKEKGLNPEDFEGYLQMHKYGIPPEGGFGMGLQRLTMNLLGLSNIKEATIFPRDVVRLTP